MHTGGKLGDAIARVAQPVAQGLDWALGTDLQNCGGCKQMQANLNAGMSLSDAFYDRFFTRPKKDEAD
jgi:hypothetical protein